MKINKRLSAAITLSLMLGMYGSASAANLYGTSLARDDSSISTAEVTRPGSAVTKDEARAHNSGHSFTVLSGTWEDIYGGHGDHGDYDNAGATYNSVTIGGSNVTADTVYGGYNDQKIATAKVNTVTVSGTNAEIAHDVYGSYLNVQGMAFSSTVNISSGTIGGDVYGGYTKNGRNESNVVNLSGGTISGDVFGGKTDNGNVGGQYYTDGNKVNITGGTVGTSAYGGYTDKGDAKSNIATMSGGTVGGDVYGGYGANASDNSARVNNGSVNDLIGGLAYKGDAKKNYAYVGADVEEKPTAVTIDNVYGGKASNNATGNYVNIRDTWFKDDGGSSDNSFGIIPTINESVYGGYAEKGIAGGNTVSITAGKIKHEVYGGYTENGTAGVSGEIQGNTVTINGLNTSSKVNITRSVYGGQSINGAANGNKVGTSGNFATNFTAAYVYGGKGVTGASNNEVYLGNGVNVDSSLDSTVYGGYVSGKGNANGNQVTISGNAEIGNGVYGGYLLIHAVGNANNNIVNISGGKMSVVAGGYTLNGSVVGNHVNVTGGKMMWIDGGFSGLYDTATEALYASSNIVEVSGAATEVAYDVSGGSIQNGNALNNEAIVSGGTIGADVFGGNVIYQGDATGNKVNISGGEVGNNVYGGYTKKGNAVENTVTINGLNSSSKVKIGRSVYGGQSENGEANGNKVGTADKVATNFTEASVYGGDGATGAADNEVWLGAGAEVGNVVGGNSGGDSVNNKVTIETGADVYLLLGGESKYGDAIENKVTVKGNVITDVFGGSTGNGTATGNEVTISGGTIGTAGYSDTGFVYGGYTKNGDAASNEVTINNANVIGEVYGGYVQSKGDALGNEVTISGGKIEQSVYGGWTTDGNVESNKVNILGGTIGDTSNNESGFVYGGSTVNGAAVSNTVNISGGHINRSVVGGDSEAGNVDDNTVTISGSADIKKSVYGGYTKTGNAGSSKGNHVIVDGGRAIDAVGGRSFTGEVMNNTAVINGGTVDILYGGASDGGANVVSNNSVTINGGKVTKWAVGGSSEDDDALSNIATINAGIVSYLYSGSSLNGNAGEKDKGNQLIINGGEVTETATGGYSSKGNARYNNVVASAGKVNMLVGGWINVSGSAENNAVLVKDSAEIENVYGGKTSSGNATSNEVTISGGQIGEEVYGGYTKEGIANANSVTISGGTIGEDAIGGTSREGNATNNIVNITGGSLEGTVIGGSAADYDSTESKWYGEGDATGNTVTVANATIGKDGNGGIVNGGYALKGDAADNNVTIESGTIGSIINIGMFTESGGAIGGFTKEGNAKNNTVTINGGTIGAEIPEDSSGGISSGDIAGGESFKGDATENKIIINAGVINKDVIGGHAWEGNAVSNEVTINGGTFSNDICGGESSTGTANSNIVNIKSGTFADGIYGGYSFHETANNNIVNISGDADTSAADVYGGKGASAGSGNTLNIDTWSGKAMNSLNDFQAINIKDTKDIKVDNVDGLADKGVELKIQYAALDTEMGALKVGDEIVFIEKTGSGDALDAKFSSAKLNGYNEGEGIWLANKTGFGVEGDKADFQINETKAFVGITENLLAGTFVDDKGNSTSETLVLDAPAGAYEKIYGTYDARGTAAASTVEMKTAMDLSSSTVYGNNVSAAGNTLKVAATDVVVKGIENFETLDFTLDSTVADGSKVLTVNSEVKDVKSVNITGVTDTKLAVGESAEVLNATNIKGDVAYNLDGTAVKNGDIKGYASTVANGVNVNQVEFAADTTKVALKVKEQILTGKFVAGNGTETAAELVVDNGAAAYTKIYGAYAENGVATPATVNLKQAVDLSSSTVFGNNVSAAGNTLKVAATDVVVKGMENFETVDFTLDSNVADGSKILTVNSEVKDVKNVNITGVTDTKLAVGESAEVLNATNIKGDVAYNLDGTAVKNGDIKGYASTVANGVNVNQVEFAADTTKVALNVKEQILTGKFVAGDGTETAAELVVDSGAAAYAKVYGAYAENGAASAATVNLNKAADLSSSTLYGNNVSAAGNTLNVTATGIKVKALENFENMNFYIPVTAAAGDTMVEVGNNVDLTNVNVAAGFHNENTLGYGDKVKLVAATAVSGLDGISEQKVACNDFIDYDVLIYQGDAGMNQVETGATTLVAELANTELSKNSKILLETTMAAATVIADGSDLLAGKTFDSAASAIAADLETGAPAGKMSLFGAMSGNKAKVKTGSHVDVEGWNMNLGFAKELKNKNGKLVMGPLVEYGRGDYDSYLDNSYHAKGNSHYIGGGFMAKQVNKDGNYFEGSLRMGKVTSDFKSTGGTYDTDAKYLAGHIGVGRVQKMDAKNSMDYYAKFFHTHMDGDEVKVMAKNKPLDLTLDSTNSSRLRIGTRLNHLMGEKSAYYIGFAWQREFNGLASGALAGKEIVSPSIKGNTGFMELGVKLFSADQYDLDLGAMGSVGKKKGAGINLNFNFKF